MPNLLLFQIRSDFQQDQKVEYFLEGPGANQKPFNVFVVNHETGDVRVTKILDREEVDTYVVSFSMFYLF